MANTIAGGAGIYNDISNDIKRHALNEQMQRAQYYVDQNIFNAKLPSTTPALTGNPVLLLLED